MISGKKALHISKTQFAGDVLLKPIVQEAGKDISHWFDKKTKDVSNDIYRYSQFQNSSTIVNYQ